MDASRRGAGPRHLAAGSRGGQAARVLKALVVLGALATGLIALWLFYVVVVVLPTHDPQRVGLWTALASGFAVYAAVTAWLVVRGARPAWLRWCVAALSLGAFAFGVYTVGSMVDPSRGRFEGYLLVIGVVLAGQGVSALAYTALAARRANSAAAS